MSQIGYVLSDFPVLSETFVGTEIRAMKALGHSIQPMAFRLNPNGGQPIDDELARSATALSAVSTKHAMVEWLKKPSKKHQRSPSSCAKKTYLKSHLFVARDN